MHCAPRGASTPTAISPVVSTTRRRRASKLSPRKHQGPMSTERGRSRPLSWFLLRSLALGAGVAAVAYARRWLDVVEVQGRSMAPALLPGEWLLVERRTYAHRRP